MIVAIDQFDKSCWLIGNIAARRQIRLKLAFHETAVTCAQWVAETQDALAPVIASAFALCEVVALLLRYERSIFGGNRREGRRRQIGVITGAEVHVL